MQNLSPTFVLPYLLQSDQLTVCHYLDKANLYVNTKAKTVSNLEKFIYPRSYGITALIVSLKDPFLYPVQGLGRFVFSIIACDKKECLQGLKNIFVSSFQAVALSVYLFVVAILGIFSATSSYGYLSPLLYELGVQHRKTRPDLLGLDFYQDISEGTPEVSEDEKLYTPSPVEDNADTIPPSTVKIKSKSASRTKSFQDTAVVRNLPFESGEESENSSAEGDTTLPGTPYPAR